MLATTSKVNLRTEQNVLTLDYVKELVVLCEEKSHIVPSGITRKQRREWSKSINPKGL